MARAMLAKRQLKWHSFNANRLGKKDICAFLTVRKEIERIPYFLEHYRRLGVENFFVVDNSSHDGTKEYLSSQTDVSLWTTNHGYKESRLGLDWTNALLMKYSHVRWCLSLDADEIIIYPHHETRNLNALVECLDRQGETSFGAMMLDMYAENPLGETSTGVFFRSVFTTAVACFWKLRFSS